MGKLKSLAGDTVIYGFSTILGRLLNWLLTPFYIRTISQSDFGIVVSVYSVIAVLLVVGTLGFETGYFRFINSKNRDKLFDTLSLGIFGSCSFILLLFAVFGDYIGFFLELGISSTSLLVWVAAVILVDSLNSIPFAQLRYENKSLKFALLRLSQVIVTVLFNILFLVVLKDKTFLGFTFSHSYSVHFILAANFLGSLSSTIYLFPLFIKRKYNFDFSILKPVFAYCLPLVGMGFFGILNQNIEKILIVKLVTTGNSYEQLAIYGANYKIGVLMAIFTQSFRLAFEPFFFKESKNSDKTEIYGLTFKYFIFFGLIIYSIVLLFLPYVNILLTPEYIEGNSIIPYILFGQLLFGAYYSLSIWYKLTDKTYFGIIMSILGLSLNSILNVLFLPRFGYIGAAYSTFIGYLFMVILSLFFGNKYYPIKYPLTSIILHSIFVVSIVYICNYTSNNILPDYWFLISSLGFLIILAVFAFGQKVFILNFINRVRHRNN